MTRPKVENDKRKRTAQACDSCKRRKQKCNGQCPCNTCTKRQLGCTYLTIHHSVASGSPSPSNVKRRRLTSEPDEDTQSLKRNDRSAGSQQKSRDASAFDDVSEKSSVRSTRRPRLKSSSLYTPRSEGDEEAENQPMTRMLLDPRGRLLYVGDTAALSFLQLIRMMVETTRGPSAFTNDPHRHRLTENELSLPSETESTHLLPEKKTCLVLVTSFFDNTQGVTQAFDEQKFLEDLDQCYSDPLSANRSWLCLLNLVLAIGLVLATPVVRSPEAAVIETLRRKQPNQSDVFYYNAKQLNDPIVGLENADFWSVQALMLVTLYMLCRSKRNSAYAYLGMAVRSAYSLGLHREEALVIFSAAERDIRRQVWRSLYIMDRFLAISLGRPTAIAQEDCSGEALDPPPSSPDSSPGHLKDISSGLEAGVRGCHFMTLVLKKVYQQRKVSTKVAREVADLCKEWPKSLPRSLHWQQATPNDRRQAMAILHVNTLYCYSVLMFTRPFFTYLLSTEMQRIYLGSDQVSKSPHRKMEVYSEACTIAALHTIALVNAAYDGGYLPRQDPFIIFSLFSAGLIILSGKLVPRTNHPASNRFVEDATTLLSYCGQTDPQAAKMLQIYTDFRDVVAGRESRPLPSLVPTTQNQPTFSPGINHNRRPALFSERETSSRGSYTPFSHPTPPELTSAMAPVLPMSDSSPGLHSFAAPGTVGVDPSPRSAPSFKNDPLSGLLDLDVNIFHTGSEDSFSGAEEQLDFDTLWQWPGAQLPPLNQNMGILDVSNSSVPLFSTLDLTGQY